ncbi:MAG TPA: type-F conjugative transfer system secretin TraK [Planctomycetota bacterium]|nr:type-F conjugative transfer system secretin TraK [Planctomycetota bacterium]
MSVIAGSIVNFMLVAALAQQNDLERPVPPGKEPAPSPKESTVIEWKEGVTIPVRVPVVGPGRELMTTLSFPEESIETAVTGWPEGEITAIQKRGLLFLRLAKKSEGQLNVIGGSGAHYLVYLRGVDSLDSDTYDPYVKIKKKEDAPKGDLLPKRQNPRPSGAVELLQAMRLGLHPEGVKILRAKRELAFEAPYLEVRLLYVYDAQSYRGMIFEVKNPTDIRQAVDASHFRGRGTALILSAMKENVVEPKSVTRLYALTWKD